MSKRKSVDLLPVIFRTEANSRFLAGTVDQLIQQPNLKKVDGFIGDRTVPNYSPATDSYVNTLSSDFRSSYELEPGIVIRNDITDQVEFSKTYEDMLNSFKFFGSDVSNQDKLFKQQSYAWNPHFDLDKFINYRNYIWMPAGPATVRITGKEKNVTSTIKVTIKEDSDGLSWKFSNNSIAVNPTLTLYRGLTYIFQVDSIDQTFYIKTKRSSGDIDAVENIPNNGTTLGSVVFEVTEDTPGTLFYVSGKDNTIFGKFLIRDQLENTELNVETDILGKTEYIIKDQFKLSNGMKITFSDTVTPEEYKNNVYIVEGVGKSISLVDYNSLVTIESYATQVETSFDSDGFDDLPFDEVSEYPLDPDYIVINRASNDKNPWSRYNRWFHIDVIVNSSEYNKVAPEFDETNRAKRPIIEFNPNIQLYNFASTSKTYINFLDDTVTDAFSNIEGSLGFYIDGYPLQEGNKIVFTAEKDVEVRNNVYQVQFLDIDGIKKIHLELIQDGIPSDGQGLLVLNGQVNGRTSWVFKNNIWTISQIKTSVNQPPLFDVFDEQGISYSSIDKYFETNFSGTKIFGYQIGTGANDSELGFPIKYGNVANVGGYLFESCLSFDSWEYFTSSSTPITILAKDGFVKNVENNTFENLWVKCDKESIQEIIDQKIAIGGEDSFEFTSLNIDTPVSALRIFKNGKLLVTTEYQIRVDKTFDSYFINFATTMAKDDVIVVKAKPLYNKKADGYYETPINLINNPLNSSPVSMSYAEINDHLNSILLNATKDLGTPVDKSNLRDKLSLEKYGRRFVQHNGLVALAGSLVVDKDINVINSIRWAAAEYQKYKTILLQKFIELDSYTSVSEALDTIISNIASDKTLSSTFYYSDMVPYGTNKRNYEYTVKDSNITAYAYGSEFYDFTVLDNKAILVYLNNRLLSINSDYTFDNINPLVKLTTTLAAGDKIVIKSYSNIYGACMPFSPTKLGLYPAFKPEIYLDDTYIEATNVVQGHDGSITVCFDDDRDLLLLELETRIYNNLRVHYNPQIFDINDVIPGIFRSNQYDISRINATIEEDFLRWTGLYSVDYKTNTNEEYAGNFSYNFVDAVGSINPEVVLNGSWRKIYKYYFDTDRPHTHPWEMLGFSVKPLWWEIEYGPAPYTSGNEVLWKDLEDGYIRDGVRKGYDVRYKRLNLNLIIPVDTYGDLRDPIDVNVVKNFDYTQRYSEWKFGDMGPAENSWRRSHLYPFAIQLAVALNAPAKYFSLCFDTSRNKINLSGQVVYSEDNQRISPTTVKIYGDKSSGLVLTTGYSPYVVEHLRLRYVDPSAKLKSYLHRLQSNLIYKVGGFTSKDKFKVALETVTNYKTVDKVFVPDENYQIYLSVGTPIKTLAMSGIIVERGDQGYIVRGYDSINPYFKIYKAMLMPNDQVISVGGVSEQFITWASNSNVSGGTIVQNGQKYFRAVANHITKETFESSLYFPLPYLPTTGGIEAQVPKNFENVETIVPYGTVFNSIQSVYEFILGYGKYLEAQGFTFNSVMAGLDTVANWELSGKEFLFWSVQNWSTSSVISLSPFAGNVSFYSKDSVVDDLYDVFYDYSLLKSDGTIIDRNKISIAREDSKFVIDTAGIENDGVYFVKINLIQKEHVVVFDNHTIFGDLIYAPTSGYRQRRFKITSFVTDGWNGDYFVPGFVYDSAKIDNWQANTDYSIGDVVKFQTKYYQAKTKLLASVAFKYEDWSLLGKQPVAQLLPNFEYKITQFEDFYSLDSVNFDNSQEKYAQKLIGYVPRKYLNSLITDQVSQYKFYQGFIREKGTAQPLEKFSVAHNTSLGSHISIQEEWAIRLGTFGGENTYKEMEFTLDQNKFTQDPQIFEFEYSNTKATSNKSYPITLSDVVVKPNDYDGKPWPILNTNIDEGNGYLQHQKIATAGYVRLDDVTFTALYEDNILALSTTTAISEGDTVWIAMDTRGDWSVRRYTISPSTIINYTYDNSNNLIQFVTDVAHQLSLRDFVSVTRLEDPLNGIYEVIGIPTPTTFVVATKFNDIAEPTELLSGSLYYFGKSRFDNLDSLATIPGLARWQDCEFVWVDNDGTGNWAVYERERGATALPLRPYLEQATQYFGETTVIAPKSKNVIVAATRLEKGRVYIYNREILGSDQIVLTQSYLMDENSIDLLSIQTVKNGITVAEMPRNHGFSVDCWENDSLTVRYIVSGAPNTSNAKWDTVGVPDPIRKPLLYSKISSGLFDEGAIKIVSYNTGTELYETNVVLASPVAQASANFGYTVKFVGSNKPALLVSSIGQNQGVGSVFQFYLDNNNIWQVYLESSIPFDFRSKVQNINSGSQFGWDIASSVDGTVVAISAPNYVKDNIQAHSGAVFIFVKDPVTYGYTLEQTIYADDYLQQGDLLLKGVTKTYDTQDYVLNFDVPTNSLIRNKGNFIQDGFRIGQTVVITNTASNNSEFIITELTAVRMGFSDNNAVVTENVDGTMTITGLGTARKDRFGDKINMDATGNILIISSDHASEKKLDAGLVYVLKRKTNGEYDLDQTVNSPALEVGELFGGNMALSQDGKTLLVTAAGGGQSSPMSFDSYTERYIDAYDLYGSEFVLNPRSSLRPLRTTFDNNSTRIVNRAVRSGTVYLYQQLDSKYVFGESLISGDSANADGYGSGVATDGDFCVVGSPKYDLKVLSVLDSNNPTPTLVSYADAGTVVLFDKKMGKTGSWTWSKARDQENGLVDVDKIKKVISYNNETLAIIDNYEIFDPVKGKFPTKVAQEIKYITPFDPAVYTVAVNPSTTVRVDNKTTWTEDHVGELWLDTSTLRYMWYEQGNEDFRSNNWGKTFPGSTVDVYEWVKSDYRPSEWSQLADTPEGLAVGLSGQPKNPDNTVVAVNQYYDPVINDFINVYYFWVRNKLTIPELAFRSISSFECSRLIEDPKLQGLKFASFLSPKSVSLTNAKQDLNADKINIDIYYQTNEQEVNRHSHWQLINENMEYLNVDPSIEIKLFDSLVGQDKSGNLVPDPKLSTKLKYGTLFRPRQSWFVNRDNALKTMIEYANGILSKHDVIGKVNLDSIDSFESIPLEKYGFYDEIVETEQDILSIGTSGKVRAELTAVVANGRLISVDITNPGFGYRIAPTVNFYGNGTGAKIQTAIDLVGRIVSVAIINQGFGYDVAPNIIVRSYAVLTQIDTSINKWAIYQIEGGTFQRKISQTYDTTKYWDYIDWVDSTYSSDTPAEYVLGFISDLESYNFEIGNTVEITNTGDSRKIILRKTALGSGNYLDDYDLIFREQGTIKFSNKLYDKTASGIGFDNVTRYDQGSFDETNSIELRTILEALKNDIFIGDLAIYWNKFLFVAIRYVLSEQLFVDWIYKTSFITPVIDAGTLDQRDVYRFNDFSYVEDFIKEIKPYKSKFRDVTVKHSAIENAQIGVTDFDLPAYVDENGIIQIPTGAVLQNQYPFKHWYNNIGYEVSDIRIGKIGANYLTPPIVTIVPAPGDEGTGATAEAKISNGSLSQIVVTNPGSGYLKSPLVILSGGSNYTENFVVGSAYATLKNSKVRNNSITVKFDRTSEKGLFTGEYYNRSFTTDGTTLNYVLAYPVNDLDSNYPALQDKDNIKVFLNEVEISADNYRITFRNDLSTVITFNVALPAQQQLRIQYIKNILYTKDVFTQSEASYTDTFQLTYPPELDNQKMIVKLLNTETNSGSDVIASDYILRVVQETVGFTKYVGYIVLKNIPPIGTKLIVQYAKNINIQNAVDRIITSYEPTSGMPGKDITQLMKGVEFGGVEIQGLNFSVSSGWDGLPWFTQGWDTFVNEYKDLLVISDGTTSTYDLGYVPLMGTQINVYFDGVRVDDENWQAPTSAAAYFRVTDGVGRNDFVIKLTDPVKIQNARDQLNNVVPKLSITGLIIKSTVDYNPNYSYHYDSDTIDFFDVAAEVCDATFEYTEDNLADAGGAFLPGLRLCPWNSLLLEEVSFTPIGTALFKTLTTNGVSNTITLPIVPTASTKIEVRQSMSDGVNLPTDDIVLDTNLNGGDFTTITEVGQARYRTASGLRPDDIAVDGGQFLSVEHSPAPEELVRGEIFDTMSLTVFNSPSSGSNKIKTFQFQYDGTNPEFTIDGALDSDQDLSVFIGNFETDRTADYTITNNTNGTTTVALTTDEYGLADATTDERVIVTLQTMSIGGKNILFRSNYIVTAADTVGNSIEIETPVNLADIGSIYVSTSKTTTISKMGGRSKRAKVVIENLSPKLDSGTLVTVILFSSATKTYSEVYNQEIVVTGATRTYALSRPPGNIAPLHVMAAVTRITPASNNWQGNWQENINYYIDDSVVYGNNSYLCTTAHTSIGSTTELIFLNWTVSHTYSVDDIVVHNGEYFICIASHTSNSTTITTANETYWLLHSTNRPDEDVNLDYWQIIPKQRLMPPETEYYEVSQNEQTFALGENIPYLVRTLAATDIEVYKNGKLMVSGQEYQFNYVDNTVTLSNGVAQVGDVIAISVLKDSDYYIRSGNIIFTASSKVLSGQRIVVTTYTNHDENLMRREVFKGYQYKNEYNVSRPVYDINNVWVDLNGTPLVPNYDFSIVDLMYVKLSEKFNIGDTDRIVITSISDVNSDDPLAYRIFKDITNTVQYKRISKASSTKLVRGLSINDREIEVIDASIFGEIVVNTAKPGVLFVAGERIEFRSINGNTLGNLTRGTLGTGISEIYLSGTTVFNFSQSETIPYKEGNIVKTYNTPSNYRYNSETQTYQRYVSSIWTNVTDVATYELTDFNLSDSVDYTDQVTVYMAGRVLIKPAKIGNEIVKHDFGITLNSNETNSLGVSGDVVVDPDFTIVKEGDSYILKINPNTLMREPSNAIIANIQIKVVQKIGKIWYTLDGNKTLQEESTVQARFLQEKPSELPDKYYYATAQTQYIRTETGVLLTDENGDPLELE